MKKITMLFMFLFALCGHAQVKDYTFAQTTGQYEEISDGTLLGGESSTTEDFIDSASGSTSVEVGQGFDIGFNFVFNGLTYNRFGVCNKGWISLGISTATPNPVDMRVTNKATAMLSTNAAQAADLMAIIAPLQADIIAQPQSSLMYKLIGSGTNHTLIIQWKNYKKLSGGTGDSFNFQIRLNEGTNTIQFVYGSFQSSATSVVSQIGLRAAPVTSATNFVLRKSSSSFATTEGTAIGDKVTFNNTSMPTLGTTFTWTPPTCGGVKDFTVSNLAIDGATLSWGAYVPVPSSFEYVVSTSSTLPTGSGTGTSATTLNVTDLNPTTVYYVFIRNKCGSQFTNWKQVGSFKTKCADVSVLFENFDSYSSGTTVMPDCWSKVIVPSTATSASVSVASGAVTPGSAPNRLLINGRGEPTNLGTAYAILPVMTNIGAKTHRLKFKAYTNTGFTNRSIEVGYFTDASNATTFKKLTTINLPEGSANAIEFSVVPGDLELTPGALDNVKNLGFKNSGYAESNYLTQAYIDDVIWEPNPSCSDIKDLKVTGLTHTTVEMSWTPEATTAWQYAYALPSVTNPYALTGTDVTGTGAKVQISGLTAATSYKVWIRSKCDHSFGAWIGPIAITTTCAPISEFAQYFDLSTSVPSCWNKVGSTGTLSVTQTSTPAPPSGTNTCKIDGKTSGVTILALPPLSSAQKSTHRLKFKVRTDTPGNPTATPPVPAATLDFGYLENPVDPTSFIVIKTYSPGSAFSSEEDIFGASPKSDFLAFRNSGAAGSVFIDDVVWEFNPNYPDVKEVKVTAVTSNEATLQWKAGQDETKWQYILGTANDVSPFGLPVSDFQNVSDVLGIKGATISGLTPNSTYRIWIRSKFDDTKMGSWVGPFTLITSCTPGTEFSEKFEAVNVIPACWKVAAGNVSTNVPKEGSQTAPSAPYVLIMDSASTTSPAIIAMPAMSNTSANTHRLTFKYRGAAAGAILEVGFLLSIADATTFVPIQGASFPCTTAFQDGIALWEGEIPSKILAFRNNGTGVVSIDNVEWAHVPFCEDITKLKVTSVSDVAINVSWTKGATETAWQYAVGPMTATSPEGTFYEVTDTPYVSATKLSSGNLLEPNTSYKIWVRSKCDNGLLGNWGTPVSAKTTCSPTNILMENFQTDQMPGCWTRLNAQGVVHPTTSSSELSDGYKLYMYSTYSADVPLVAMPPLSNAGDTDYILKFKFKGTAVGAKLEVGYITNILYPEFTLIKSFEATSKDVSEAAYVSLGASPVSNILAFRVPGQNNVGVLIDNVSWNATPHIEPTCATNVSATTNSTCGTLATVISWDAVAGADGYLLDISTASGSNYIFKDKDLATSLKYSFVGDANTTFYYKVRPYNYFGSAIGCTEGNFTTKANKCYCISEPAANDNLGISNVKLGTSNFEIPDVTYKDNSGQSVNIELGKKADLQVTFSTFKPYNMFVWIDFNNNYIFDDNEKVFTGQSAVAAQGNVSLLDASFDMPQNATAGKHRMRIVSWPGSGPLSVDACYNGAYGITLDFDVNVVSSLSVDTVDSLNFSYYPNPVKEVLNLSYDKEINDITVVNLLGQQVLSKSVNANQGTLNMSGLSRGAYLVKVTVGNQSKTIKVIKE